MLLRQRTEEWERHHLSSRAMSAAQSQGRAYPDPQCDVRTVFQRDRDRILHCKAFRRLKGKTQVFISPSGDHYRTRLTHTLEVAQISRTVARALQLNEDLTEAIALGHDLGHTPFGHAGEAALKNILGHFRHNEQSVRVVESLEQHSPRYPGLNLTVEVREGILGHTGASVPSHLEGQIVRICDRVAYLNHDIEDAVRGGVLTEDSLPKSIVKVLGNSRSERIDFMVRNLIETSAEQDFIGMDEEAAGATDALREFLFEHVYIGSEAKREEEKVLYVIEKFYQYFLSHPEELQRRLAYDMPAAVDSYSRGAADYVAGMTDSYAVSEFHSLFLPQGWSRR